MRRGRRWSKKMSNRFKKKVFKRGRRMQKLNYPRAGRGGFRF